eukprot:TRINITY_DN13260_c0_g1_i2.p1 TRINITY_DN13260_c0_g1~~TRINITY_DN13260_c0_g1_i2.p1  ORF type:complete len:968 (+),score=226.98 TRINITY_DN13260_c0_g1_i2:387-2906(+)
MAAGGSGTREAARAAALAEAATRAGSRSSWAYASQGKLNSACAPSSRQSPRRRASAVPTTHQEQHLLARQVSGFRILPEAEAATAALEDTEPGHSYDDSPSAADHAEADQHSLARPQLLRASASTATAATDLTSSSRQSWIEPSSSSVGLGQTPELELAEAQAREAALREELRRAENKLKTAMRQASAARGQANNAARTSAAGWSRGQPTQQRSSSGGAGSRCRGGSDTVPIEQLRQRAERQTSELAQAKAREASLRTMLQQQLQERQHGKLKQEQRDEEMSKLAVHHEEALAAAAQSETAALAAAQAREKALRSELQAQRLGLDSRSPRRRAATLADVYRGGGRLQEAEPAQFTDHGAAPPPPVSPRSARELLEAAGSLLAPQALQPILSPRRWGAAESPGRTSLQEGPADTLSPVDAGPYLSQTAPALQGERGASTGSAAAATSSQSAYRGRASAVLPLARTAGGQVLTPRTLASSSSGRVRGTSAGRVPKQAAHEPGPDSPRSGGGSGPLPAELEVPDASSPATTTVMLAADPEEALASPLNVTFAGDAAAGSEEQLQQLPQSARARLLPTVRVGSSLQRTTKEGGKSSRPGEEALQQEGTGTYQQKPKERAPHEGRAEEAEEGPAPPPDLRFSLQQQQQPPPQQQLLEPGEILPEAITRTVPVPVPSPQIQQQKQHQRRQEPQEQQQQQQQQQQQRQQRSCASAAVTAEAVPAALQWQQPQPLQKPQVQLKVASRSQLLLEAMRSCQDQALRMEQMQASLEMNREREEALMEQLRRESQDLEEQQRSRLFMTPRSGHQTPIVALPPYQPVPYPAVQLRPRCGCWGQERCICWSSH